MTRFRKLLIANRGEIAVRIMRTCRELGIDSVAIYGEDERDAPHVRFADEAYRLDSDLPIPYLDIEAILRVAGKAGADAIHPGYGFLAENPHFADACLEAGVTFVGPSSHAIEAMGDKIRARAIARSADVPLVPGSDGPVDEVSLHDVAESIGFPVALKAAAGGGGRGFRVAANTSELEDALRGASGEAERYFGDGRVYMERYLERPRHVEIQILADSSGNVIALGERECSVQRRHQKLIEEAPSPAVSLELRGKLEGAAVRLANSVEYRGAGTVEFLVQDEEYYFLEMNTRIQVEHPVTEMITGVDLVAEQIRIASGENMNPNWFSVRHGHAIECRINAEDPVNDFQPASGVISESILPDGPGVRVDGVMQRGAAVSPRYDSMLGKLIVWGPDRTSALARMDRALRELEIRGVPTTAGFHQRVIGHPAFVNGDYDIRFLERYPEVLASLVDEQLEGSDSTSDGLEPTDYLIEVNGKRFDVRVYLPEKRKRRAPVLAEARTTGGVAVDGSEIIVSPIQGTVLAVSVSEGDSVRAGDVICTIEAMKMENEISAGRDGTVTQLDVQPGKSVESGAVIAVIVSG